MPPSCFFFFFVAGAVSGDGTFLLGSIDHAKYSGKISYDTAPYPSTGAVINLDTITVNGTDVSFDESALLDSGLIVIAISDPQFKSRARFFFDCNTNVSLKFNFGHHTIVSDQSSFLLPFSYFSGTPSDTECMFAVQNLAVSGSASASCFCLQTRS